MPPYLAAGPRIAIRRPTSADRDSFIALAQASREFHHPWVEAPATPDRFDSYLSSRQTPTDDGLLLCDAASHEIVGVTNLNCLVRGHFQSAFLGYYIFAPFAGQGFMTEGMRLVIAHAFSEMKLHRLEANIQPENIASIALVRKCGFRKEGFSPQYLKVLGEWRDHERWAVVANEST